MPSRTSFTELRHLTAGQDGGFNQGILIVPCLPRAIRTGHAARKARALRSCHHPHIISLVFADLDAAGYGYGSNYMSYCELGSLDGLLSRLARRSNFPPEGFLWKILFDMATALCYLQTGLKSSSLAQSGQPVSGCALGWVQILHRDIKPQISSLRSRTAELRADTSDVYSLALSVYCVAALRDTPRLGEIVRADPAPGYSRELRGVLGRMLRLMPEDRVEVGHLPYLVWRETSVVKHERAARGFQSEKMPSWAFWE
ncbi:hypothetical protein PSPO01_04182 [Paraphaeosphaeria sporulosa]